MTHIGGISDDYRQGWQDAKRDSQIEIDRLKKAIDYLLREQKLAPEILDLMRHIELKLMVEKDE